jgi:hypothetical protein
LNNFNNSSVTPGNTGSLIQACNWVQGSATVLNENTNNVDNGNGSYINMANGTPMAATAPIFLSQIILASWARHSTISTACPVLQGGLAPV